METITTRNRKLEQFIFLHGIDYVSCGKDEDGMTVWRYECTEEILWIVKEFKQAQERRMKKGA